MKISNINAILGCFFFNDLQLKKGFLKDENIPAKNNQENFKQFLFIYRKEQQTHESLILN